MLLRSPLELGLVIRDRRRALGLDQKTLATRIGVSRQWIVAVEKGKPRAELALVLRTLSALDMAIDVREAAQPAPSVAPDPSTAPILDMDAIINAVIDRARDPRP